MILEHLIQEHKNLVDVTSWILVATAFFDLPWAHVGGFLAVVLILIRAYYEIRVGQKRLRDDK